MARPKSLLLIPRIDRHHQRSYVNIGTRKILLGPIDSELSRARFEHVARRWVEMGRPREKAAVDFLRDEIAAISGNPDGACPEQTEDRPSRAHPLMQTDLRKDTYIIGSPSAPDRVKIGNSFDPNERIKQLQTGSPVPLVIIERIPGLVEQILHDRFEKLRIWPGYEWFYRQGALERWLGNLQFELKLFGVPQDREIKNFCRHVVAERELDAAGI